MLDANPNAHCMHQGLSRGRLKGSVVAFIYCPVADPEGPRRQKFNYFIFMKNFQKNQEK